MTKISYATLAFILLFIGIAKSRFSIRLKKWSLFVATLNCL